MQMDDITQTNVDIETKPSGMESSKVSNTNDRASYSTTQARFGSFDKVDVEDYICTH